MKLYLRILAVFYSAGAILHLLDVFNLRLEFSSMNPTWKAWTVYLLIFDSVSALGLWRQKSWGTILFLVVALSQLMVYTSFTHLFGNQYPLVIFHLLTLTIFVFLKLKGRQVFAE